LSGPRLAETLRDGTRRLSAHYIRDKQQAIERHTMISFGSRPRSQTDAPARQRLLGGALRRQFQSIASQAVPDHMLDLLRQADARWFATKGHGVSFAGSTPASSSLTIAMTIVGTLIGLWVLYDLLYMASISPAVMIVAGFMALLAIVITGTVWLIEDERRDKIS
jgi:hypothetical protein